MIVRKPVAKYSNVNINEEALKASLEGIEHVEHYYDIVYTIRMQGVLIHHFTLALFPAIRHLFRSDLYSIVRLYPGNATSTSDQEEAVGNAFYEGVIEDYAEHFESNEVVW